MPGTTFLLPPGTTFRLTFPPAVPPATSLLPLFPRTGLFAASVACFALLGVAAWLDPAPQGIGTHTQLGIAPCSWPALMGIPCPSCGMTTAFAHAADGHFLDALRIQPGGLVLAILTAAVGLATLTGALTGSRICSLLSESVGPKGWWSLGGLLVV